MKKEIRKMTIQNFLDHMIIDGWDFYNRHTVRGIGTQLKFLFSELKIDLSTPIEVIYTNCSLGRGKGHRYQYLWQVKGVDCPVEGLQLWEKRNFPPVIYGYDNMPFIQKIENGFIVGYTYP